MIADLSPKSTINIPPFIAQYRADVIDALKKYFSEYIPLPDEEPSARYQYICFQYSAEIIKGLINEKLNIEVDISEMGSGTSYIRNIWHGKNDPLWHGYEIECLFANNHIPYVIVGADRRGYNYNQINNGIKDDVFPGDFYRPDLAAAYRSSWEANIARIFNHLNIPYEYECKSFPLRTTQKIERGYYLPDFIWENNVVEVKGLWDAESRQKAKEFMDSYPQYRYYMVDADMYMTLQSKYGSKISTWEHSKMAFPIHTKLQIVGINYGDRRKNCQSLVKGQRLTFRRDVTNHFDKNAILVLTEENEEIGFVSSDWACIYAPKIELGMKYDVSVTTIHPSKIEVDVVRANPDVEIIYSFFS